MQCILTALKAESKPLIDYFRLSKSKSFDFPVFENEALDLSLIGLGVGTVSYTHLTLPTICSV